MDRNRQLGERIQQRRQYLERRYPHQFTQEAVADRLTEMGFPITHTSISHYERGRTTLTAEFIEKIAEVLQVPVQWVYGDDQTIDDFTEEVMQESIRMVAALDGKPDEVSQAAKDHVLRTFRTIRSTVGT